MSHFMLYYYYKRISLGCKALSWKNSNQFGELFLHGGFKQGKETLALLAWRELEANQLTDNFLNASIG